MNLLFTAGTQFPFPRLQQALEQVAVGRPGWQLVFQAGPDAELEGLRALSNVVAQPLFSGEEFQRLFMAADLVVSHAGMGNIIACLEAGKPLVLLPRQAKLGEHRNDHQMDTAEAFLRMYNVPAAQSVAELVEIVTKPAHWPQGGESAAERLHSTRSAFAKKLNALLGEL